MRFPVDTTCFSQEPGIKGKEHRWKQAASVAYGSITSSGVCLWQPWTGQEDWQADRLIISTKCSLWEDISASTALSMAVRETWGGKKTNKKKAKKINSRGKINSWWIFSLLGNIKHCKLFNLTTLMSQTRAGSCRRRHTCEVTKRETKRTSQLLKNQSGVKRCCKPSAQKTASRTRRGRIDTPEWASSSRTGKQLRHSSVVYLRLPNIHSDELFLIYFAKEKCKIKWRKWHFSSFFFCVYLKIMQINYQLPPDLRADNDQNKNGGRAGGGLKNKTTKCAEIFNSAAWSSQGSLVTIFNWNIWL